MTNDIHQILTERGDRYGSFQTHAELSQSLKTTITKAASARSLPQIVCGGVVLAVRGYRGRSP